MAILSTTHININGNKLSYYSSCSLHQEIGEHHTLDLHCLLETIQSFCNDNNQEIEDLLGAVITIETKSYADLNFHGTLKFKGVITNLKFRKGMFASDGDFVIINAKSPTIIADDGPHYTSYNDISFVDIIQQNFTNYDTSKLSINTNNSKLTEPLTYTVQYNESCFNFAKRLAARNGEWMYYNGEELVFGIENNSKEEVELILGRDLQDFNTALSPIPQNFNYYTNDYLKDDIHEVSSSSSDGSNEENFGVVNDSSKELYANQTKIWVNISDDDNAKNRLDKYVKLQQETLQTNQIKVSGTSDNPGVVLAATIKISQSTYRVTKVSHSYSSNGEYENFFEATSTNIDTYPKTNVNAFPKAQSQTAKVIENHDPEGLGRIKVQFPWQKIDGLSTPWVRYIASSASPGQGFFFIPEIDDEVLIDFEGGNAECPYALGGLYNSNATPPSGSDSKQNFIKILQGKSGAFIKIDDEAGSITLQDKAGSSIILNGKGNISISATDEVSVNGPKEVSLKSDDEVSLNGAKEVSIISPDEVSINGGKEVSIISDNEVFVKGTKEVGINSDMEVKVTGTAKAALSSSGTTSVEGTIIKLN